MTDATILDLGIGNVAAVRKMCRMLGREVEVTESVAGIRSARRLIIPGVGAFDAAAKVLHRKGLVHAIRTRANSFDLPILGLCLGMHLLLEGSDEGTLPGIGLFAGRARRIQAHYGVKVPHMGWNTVRIHRQTSLTRALEPDSKFYFAHSFAPELRDEECLTLTTDHGQRLVAGMEKGLVTGVQFHPEKSHRFGKALFEGFFAP